MSKQNNITSQILTNMTGVAWEAEYRFHPIRKWRFDYACPQFKIAIEQEGGIWTKGRHLTGKGFLADMEKYNEATVMGWHLLRYAPNQMLNEKTFEQIRRLISILNQPTIH